VILPSTVDLLCVLLCIGVTVAHGKASGYVFAFRASTRGMQVTENNTRGKTDVKISDVFLTVQQSQGLPQSSSSCSISVALFSRTRADNMPRTTLLPIFKSLLRLDSLFLCRKCYRQQSIDKRTDGH
jgi:hypothetical protein